MAWFYLILGGLFEVGFTTALRFVDGFRNIPWTLAFLVSVALSMGLLEFASRSIPMGTAYAVWGGIGAVGTVIVGMAFFSEPTTTLRRDLTPPLQPTVITTASPNRWKRGLTWGLVAVAVTALVAAFVTTSSDVAVPLPGEPRPAGLSGTAVSSDPMRATKNAPEMPSETSGKPRAWTTKYSRRASVAQMRVVTIARRGRARRPTASKTPSSKRS